MNKNKVGLALGFFFAAIHLIWALAVWLIPNQLQSFLDWVLNLHGIMQYMTITSMSLLKLILLSVITFVFGYIFGWLYAWFHDMVEKKK